MIRNGPGPVSLIFSYIDFVLFIIGPSFAVLFAVEIVDYRQVHAH